MQTDLLAVLRALRFHSRSTQDLENVPENAWPALLGATDRAHLTLALGVRCRESLPQCVLSRIDRNLADNASRYDSLVAAHSQIASALSQRDIEYVVIKGLSQWPYYSDDPRARPQYDIDVYIPDQSMSAATNAVQALGYKPVTAIRDPGADHLPVMIRETGWTWRGNYYDPEMPPSLELHFRFWNPQVMRFEVVDIERFWRRRVVRRIDGLEFPTLDPVDGLSYSALHLMRHLLGGDLQLRHVYEIAHFLERSAADHSFWSRWAETGLASCRIVEGIAFRLARDWFHCNLHAAARDAIGQLPSPITRWFSLFASLPAWSPALGIDSPDKNELWLHFCLLNKRQDQFEIAVRRLFPTGRARVVLDAHVPSSKAGLFLRGKRAIFEASFLAGRFLHHLRTLAPTIRGAYLWCSGKQHAP